MRGDQGGGAYRTDQYCCGVAGPTTAPGSEGGGADNGGWHGGHGCRCSEEGGAGVAAAVAIAHGDI
jgi:hypothetical protein